MGGVMMIARGTLWCFLKFGHETLW